LKPNLAAGNTGALATLAHALGVDADDLVDYLNWCLLEHLVTMFSQDRDWIGRIRVQSDGMAQFKKEVERRTALKWDVENVQRLYERVLAACGKHYRQPIRYEELLRLLINTPLKCANPACGKAPPDVKLHIDHFFPASKGGSSRFENLRFLCAKCNLSKSDKLPKANIWLRLSSLQPF
jgi:5-methylcytosine-specific restriction endonuclease McrA